MSDMIFTLPDVGEGLTEAEIVSWKVSVGDVVELNQILLEIETAKSLVELPSPFVGTVRTLLVTEGSIVAVGTPIIVIVSDPGEDTFGGNGSASSGSDTDRDSLVEDTEASVSHENDVSQNSVLVGRMSDEAHVSRRRARRFSGVAEAQDESNVSRVTSVPPVVVPFADAAVLAKPPIRRLAKDLDVDISLVVPTGEKGEVTREDVIREAKQARVFRNISTPEWSQDREERIPVRGVRKAIAQAMVSSAFSAPHVSLFVDVDATRTMEYVKRLKTAPDFVGVKISPLLIMAKAMVWAVRRNPSVNSAWTDEEIIVRNYVNLGVAAATPRGLIVPNVKDAHMMTLRSLAGALEHMTATAREGKTPPSDMQNGTITVTNIGVFGMDTGTPILNSGEVAIVALGTIKQKPWVVDGEVRVRYVTTIGASFDHRVVDGDVASRFLADVASIIEEPALLLD